MSGPVPVASSTASFSSITFTVARNADIYMDGGLTCIERMDQLGVKGRTVSNPPPHNHDDLLPLQYTHDQNVCEGGNSIFSFSISFPFIMSTRTIRNIV